MSHRAGVPNPWTGIIRWRVESVDHLVLGCKKGIVFPYNLLGILFGKKKDHLLPPLSIAHDTLVCHFHASVT